MVEVTQADLTDRLRRAFDANSVAEKNLAIRAAYDFIAAHREAAYEVGLKAGAEAERVKLMPVIYILHTALAQHICYGCPACPGDCSSANPPMIFCPTQLAIKAFRMFDASLDYESDEEKS